MMSDLTHFFNPRSIAVVGASCREGKIGYRLVYNIVKGGFKGEAFLINTKAGEILGVRVYEHLNAVDAVPDVAKLMAP